jgi:4-hydroxybenzoate polyprenyltransferase
VTSTDLKRPLLPLAMLRAMRPKQWPKNGALLAPLLFAKGVFAQGLALRAFVGLMAFSLLASGVYVLNDWFDRDKDRLHPEKRKRPIAAGHLGGGAAVVLVGLCWGASAGLGYWLGLPFMGVMGSYLLLQVFYTFGIKRLVILDVMAIALGFIIRVVAGAVAIDVVVSNWLFLCTLLLSIFLGFSKRRAEISQLEDDATAHRKNLADYSLPLLDQMMSISASATIVSYGLYTVEHPASAKLKFTIPFVLYGVFRYLFLVHKRGLGGAPEKVLLGDVPMLATVGLYVAVVGWALYF